MIIQIRGTSGSGKSTVVKKVMENVAWEPSLQAGRKKPLYYSHQDIVVLGHYESPCGGCDTIGSAPKIFELIEALRNEVRQKPPKILCEGLLLSEDTRWTLQMPRDELKIVFLTTELDECLERIKGRREKVGNEKPLNPANTSNRVGVIERARLKLTAEGIACYRASSEQAPDLIKGWLGLS